MFDFLYIFFHFARGCIFCVICLGRKAFQGGLIWSYVLRLLLRAARFLYMALKDKGPIYILAPKITEILLRSAQILSVFGGCTFVCSTLYISFTKVSDEHHFSEHIKGTSPKKLWRGGVEERGKKKFVSCIYIQAWKHSIILLTLKLTIESHATLFSSQHEYKPHQCHKWPFPVVPKN